MLEAGSALGFMVYASLEPKESLYVEFEGEGRYKFVYYLQTQGGKRTPIFQVTMSLSGGRHRHGQGGGDVRRCADAVARSRARRDARVFFVPEDMGTPPGAIALRGATNFQTPSGWDTVYTPIFNMIERPVAPMLVRARRDRLVHARDRVPLRAAAGRGHLRSRGQHADRPGVLRAARGDHDPGMHGGGTQDDRSVATGVQSSTRRPPASRPRYGLSYSPHYLRQSRAKKRAVSARVSLIFVSYRRQDTQSATGRLCDKLQAHFSVDQVFHDIESIAPGSSFPATIVAKIAASSSCWS